MKSKQCKQNTLTDQTTQTYNQGIDANSDMKNNQDNDNETIDMKNSKDLELPDPPSEFVHKYFKSFTAEKKKKKKKKKKDSSKIITQPSKKWIILN